MTLPFSQPSWFSSTDIGAMTLNNASGSTIDVLHGCLVTGYNPRAVTSIVVASGVATATAASHGYTASYGALLLIEGSAEPLLNGRKQPLSVATNTFTYAAPGVADGTYTGTITAKRAPLGWTRDFSNASFSAFRMGHPESPPGWLRVDDPMTPATVAAIRGIATLDLVTGESTGFSPSTGYLWKGPDTATPKAWLIIGTDRFVHIFTRSVNQSARYQYAFFGEALSFKPGDGYHVITGCMTATTESTGAASVPTYAPRLGTAPGAAACISVLRGHTQTGAAVRAVLASGQNTADSLGAAGPVPNGPVDGSYVVEGPCLFAELDTVNGHPIRGAVPGLYAPLCAAPSESLFAPSNAPQKRMYTVSTIGPSNGGAVTIDLTGPWH